MSINHSEQQPTIVAKSDVDLLNNIQITIDKIKITAPSHESKIHPRPPCFKLKREA